MRPLPPTAASLPSRLVRRLVLGAAFLLAITIGQMPRTPAVQAQEAQPPAPPATSIAPAAPKAPAAPAKAAVTGDREVVRATIEIRTDDKGKKIVTVEKPATAKPDADGAREISPPTPDVGPGKDGKRVSVGVLGDDREYDSFNEFVHDEPWLAAMVVGIVAVIFLSPVLAIALILGYRMRKARMLNETMLKLAEKGIVPPAEALGALSGNPAAVAAMPSAAPLYEQARQIQRRAAWSDLRKGVIMGGIGLGLSMYSMLDDGTPNGLGLVLLFVGLGYLVLWWFEERRIAPAGNASTPPPPAGPSGGASGSA